MILEIQVMALIILLFFSALFSGIETAMMSVSRIKINSLVRKKRKGAKILHRVKQNPHRLIITILIGNNIVNIGAASLATVIFTGVFGSAGAGIATGVMTLLVLVFGEITPKTFAAQNAENISLIAARPLELLTRSILPIVKFFELISRSISALTRSNKVKKLSEEEIITTVTMGVKEGIINKDAAEIMSNVLEFEGTKVTKIMTPKADLAMVDGKKKLKNTIGYVVKTPYSRFPVYYKTKEKIIGILDVDDVLKYVKKKKLNTMVKTLAKPAFFVPESKEIDDLLIEFEGKHMPLALVVDEYGGISGMVTMEDILEEIVGDIFDKSRRKSIYIKKVDKKLIDVDARASIEEINNALHLGLEEEKFNTLAGFIEHKLKRIPKKGEKIKLKNTTLIIDKATRQGIKKVKIIKH
ncbi:DUF21 domain-containing protein [Candidatus Woesearchaeota archaeon]|nr:DUF21 domain-containing protein [Candidatus Woesearchaeota archaeon]